MSSTHFDYDNAPTVVGEEQSSLLPTSKGKGRGVSEYLAPTGSTSSANPPTLEEALADIAELERTLPLFVGIERSSGLLGALKKLDKQLKETVGTRLVSKCSSWTMSRQEVKPGQIGLYSHNGSPRVVLKPGRYPSWWWGGDWVFRTWAASVEANSPQIHFNGLLIVQMSQTQAAVVADPSNKTFVIRDSGFVSWGSYKVIDIVDTINLGTEAAIYDSQTKELLGFRKQVFGRTGNATFLAASFFDIPHKSVAILQRGNELLTLPAGQHVITGAGTTFRAFFTLGEDQSELKIPGMYTKDQVPVDLTIYLKWQLLDPLKLTTHGYTSPFRALEDKAKSVLTQIVGHLEYSQVIQHRTIADGLQTAPEASSSEPFLDALKARAMDEMHEAATDYGILLKDLAVIDRRFKPEIEREMNNLTTRALQAQVESANVERENNTAQKKAQGALRVAEIEAEQRKTLADAAAYTILAEAKARAEATELAAKAEAEATRMRALADEGVPVGHAQHMQAQRNEVKKIEAYGNKAVFVGGQDVGGSVASGYAVAYGAALGNNNSKK